MFHLLLVCLCVVVAVVAVAALVVHYADRPPRPTVRDTVRPACWARTIHEQGGPAVRWGEPSSDEGVVIRPGRQNGKSRTGLVYDWQRHSGWPRD